MSVEPEDIRTHRAAEDSIARCPRPVDIQAGQRNRNNEHLELDARGELEDRVGRRLTDSEWAAARSALVEFMGILCAWHQQAQANPRTEEDEPITEAA